ncbi:ankyrin repeat domain-containing protein [Kangiella shandongensis]|uniref:ankyrin repeat domain-containing protein n=1 Tax=Kangiella shandongensis TaxID=2763258 RepID=UPI001CC03C72|nr:ankyrin repeat domain-containing protein [Kangiella shandongensis]
MGRIILLLICLLSQSAWAISTATQNVFHHAQKGDSFEVERWLRKGGDPSHLYFSKGEGVSHDKTFTPMHAALAWAESDKDPADVVRVLLKYDADFEYFADINLKYATKDSFTIPPLYRAVMNDQVESARLLIEAGAPIGYNYRSFKEPELDMDDPAAVFGTEKAWRRRASLASYVDSTPMANMLFQKGAISVTDMGDMLNVRKDFVPQAGYSTLVEEYLQRLNNLSRSKKLSTFSESFQQKVSRLNKLKFRLIGALVYVNDAKGCTLAKHLSEKAGRSLNLGSVIASKGSPFCYQYFKKQGMLWPESAKKIGAGPLHVAVKYNNKRMIKWLIKKDPELLNSKDKQGRRPLLYSQSDAMVKFLLSLGATPPEEWKK